MDKIKQLLIVLTISMTLAGLAVLLFLLDPNFVPDAYRVVSMVIVAFWAFFIVPSMLFDVQLARNYFEGKSPERAFRDGVRIGEIAGFGGIFVSGSLISPITGILWYIHTVKTIVLSKKNKNRSSDNSSENNKTKAKEAVLFGQLLARCALWRLGAGDRGRTDMVSLPLDFESSASANSTTPATFLYYTPKAAFWQAFCCLFANFFHVPSSNV